MEKDTALALLGLVGENPTEADINKAYRAAMQMNHPDRYANNENLRRRAEEQSKLINEARQVLLNDTWEKESSGDGGTKAPEAQERPRDCDSCSGSGTEKQGTQNGPTRYSDIRRGCSSPSKSSPRSLREVSPIFKKRKKMIAAAMFAFSVVMMIPIDIQPPQEIVRSMQSQGEVVSVRLASKEKDLASFTVASSAGNFDVDVGMDLPSDVEVGSRGYVCCKSGTLRFDGHDDQQYVFLLPKRGSFAESILTNLGIVKGYYSLPGLVEKEEDTLFTSLSEGFSAYFPTEPQVDDSSEGASTVKDFVATSLRSKHCTFVKFVSSPCASGLFYGVEDKRSCDALADFLTQMLDSYSILYGMVPGMTVYEFSCGKMDDCLSVSTIVPFASDADSSDGLGRGVFVYALNVADCDRWYMLFGIRDTYEEAEKALASFRLT